MSIEKIRVESHQELEQMITNEINQIEKGLTVICSNVPINERAALDILCHDSNGQLVILQLGVNEDDTMLLHGIQSLDYVDKFKSFLKATYNKHKIDDKEKPRLILIAPSFSDAVRHAVESMKGIRVDLYEWEYLKLGDHKGLRLQPIFTWKPIEKSEEEKPVEKKREVKPLKKKEHEPEPSEKK
ncbi:MAG: endonuclease NucS domain-containing protein, partial [Candidatus Bathycorpusculaceae bacterium]